MTSPEKPEDARTRKEELKKYIISFFVRRKIPTLESGYSLFSKDDRIDDIPTDNLIELFVPFLLAYGAIDTNREVVMVHLEAFIENIIGLGGVGPEFLEAWKIMKDGAVPREIALAIYNKRAGFNIQQCNWDERAWLLDLISVCVCHGMSMYNSFIRESRLGEEAHCFDGRRDSLFSPRAFKVGADGSRTMIRLERQCAGVREPGRAEFFWRRIAPKMSLKEYADKVTAKMKEYEEARAARGLTETPDEVPVMRSREMLIKEDEEKDQRRLNLGNTYRMG